MSGKCIFTIPQDNQCKPLNVSRTKNFTQHAYMSWALKTQHHGLIWYRKQPQTLVTSPFITRPHLICKFQWKFTAFPASSEQWKLAFTPLESLETTLLCVTVIPKLLENLITFWFTSLGMRHYYQSPWDFQNDSKHSLKIITFTLTIFLCEFSVLLAERERERDVDKMLREKGWCQMLICKQCHLSSENIGESEF